MCHVYEFMFSMRNELLYVRRLKTNTLASVQQIHKLCIYITWLLELSHSHFSLYDRLLACSSYTDPQDFTPNVLPVATFPIYLGWVC